MAEKAFIKGKNAKLTFQLAQAGGITKSLIIQATSFSIKPNVTEINDGILGNDRDDLDTEINFFEVMLETLVRDTQLFEAFLEHQREKDLKVAMAASAVGLLVQPHDGTQKGFVARGYVLGAWEFGMGGRTERTKVPVPGRCTHIDPLPIL